MDHLMNTEAPLCPAFNQLMLEIAREEMPDGWDAIPGAPNTLADLKAHYLDTGRIAVNACNRFGLTVGDPEPYYAFRAWHDLLHVRYDPNDRFTMFGEQLVAHLHRNELYDRLGVCARADFFADLIQVEVDAANDLYVRTGHWPGEPRQFAIGYLLGRGWTPGQIATFTSAPLDARAAA